MNIPTDQQIPLVTQSLTYEQIFHVDWKQQNPINEPKPVVVKIKKTQNKTSSPFYEVNMSFPSTGNGQPPECRITSESYPVVKEIMQFFNKPTF